MVVLFRRATPLKPYLPLARRPFPSSSGLNLELFTAPKSRERHTTLAFYHRRRSENSNT